MRKKLNEIRNKEEGFTLVELLAVIVILGIILAIAIPSVGRVIERAQKNADDAEYGLIVDAGRIYLTAEDLAEADKNRVQVSTLISDGYIEERDAKGLADKKEGEKNVLDLYVVRKNSETDAGKPAKYKYVLAEDATGTTIVYPK